VITARLCTHDDEASESRKFHAEAADRGGADKGPSDAGPHETETAEYKVEPSLPAQRAKRATFHL
jgi:hypothetical protein